MAKNQLFFFKLKMKDTNLMLFKKKSKKKNEL